MVGQEFEVKKTGQLEIASEQLQFSCRYQSISLPKTRRFKVLSRTSQDKQAMNVNLACAIYDNSDQLLDVAWYGNVRSFDDCIRYRGDSLRTSRESNSHFSQEMISIRINELPETVCRLVLLAHSYYHQPLVGGVGEIVLDDAEGNSIHSIEFAQLAHNTTALLVWVLERVGEDWRVSAPIDEFTDEFAGQNVFELANRLMGR